MIHFFTILILKMPNFWRKYIKNRNIRPRFDPSSYIVLRGGDTVGEKKKYHDELFSQVAQKHSALQERRKMDQVTIG
jgi:glucan phosphoethanolaminetransferase (alkaline phosphatase superfamily)